MRWLFTSLVSDLTPPIRLHRRVDRASFATAFWTHDLAGSRSQPKDAIRKNLFSPPRAVPSGNHLITADADAPLVVDRPARAPAVRFRGPTLGGSSRFVFCVNKRSLAIHWASRCGAAGEYVGSWPEPAFAPSRSSATDGITSAAFTILRSRRRSRGWICRRCCLRQPGRIEAHGAAGRSASSGSDNFIRIAVRVAAVGGPWPMSCESLSTTSESTSRLGC
jgi:hypothetical protein